MAVLDAGVGFAGQARRVEILDLVILRIEDIQQVGGELQTLLTEQNLNDEIGSSLGGLTEDQ